MRIAALVRSFALVSFPFAALSAFACSATNPDAVFDAPGSGGNNGTTGGSNGGGAKGGASGESGGGEGGSGGGIVVTPPPDDPACGDLGQFVYVVSSAAELLRFRPKTLEFELIGTIDCPTKSSDSTPFSMAVDRNGKAWVNYSGSDAGQIFLVDTTTAACEKSPFDRDYAVGKNWKNYGMAFASDGDGGASEHLYLADATSFAVGVLGQDKGLARVNNETGKIEPVGQFDNPTIVKRGGLDLSGRGDGKLFAFVVDGAGQGSPLVAEIGKDDASILSTATQGTLPNQINAWAFAHWGGALYLFHATGSGSSATSKVSKYTPGGTTEIVLEKTKYRIVGAGVSTCAPTIEPPALGHASWLAARFGRSGSSRAGPWSWRRCSCLGSCLPRARMGAFQVLDMSRCSPPTRARCCSAPRSGRCSRTTAARRFGGCAKNPSGTAARKIRPSASPRRGRC
jgi:hypothetical protein